MTESPEERMDALLREAARGYNAPPDTPKAELWERIEAARRSPRADAGPEELVGAAFVGPLDRGPAWTRRRLYRMGIGIAALLTLGIAIGRMSAPGAPAVSAPVAGGTLASAPTAVDSPKPAFIAASGVRTPPSGTEREDRSALAARLATMQYFGQVETFLTEFDTRTAAQDFSGQAHDLLSTTRLLLDSKRLTDVRTRKLLEDLELVLVQIATLDPQGRRSELEFISDGLAQSHLRTRLRNVIPAGPAIRM